MRRLTHRAEFSRSPVFAAFVAAATLVANPAQAPEAAPAREQSDDIIVTGHRNRPIEGGR